MIFSATISISPVSISLFLLDLSATLPVTVIATKADKISGSKKQHNLKLILDTLDLVVGDDLIVFSSVTKLGVKDVLKKIEGLIEGETI